jgi:hypothetical protein
MSLRRRFPAKVGNALLGVEVEVHDSGMRAQPL